LRASGTADTILELLRQITIRALKAAKMSDEAIARELNLSLDLIKQQGL
jgi:hypothetical protein